jgi:hypothetical protein
MSKLKKSVKHALDQEARVVAGIPFSMMLRTMATRVKAIQTFAVAGCVEGNGWEDTEKRFHLIELLASDLSWEIHGLEKWHQDEGAVR